MGTVTSYYYTYSDCGSIRLIAVPFGLGPRIAGQNMAARLGVRIGKWKIYKGQRIKKAVKMLLNFGVPFSPLESNACFRVWIDCLMWLREKIPDAVQMYDLILAEKFFASNPFLLSSGLPVKEIPPLLMEEENCDKGLSAYSMKGHILVSFGGIETPYTSDIHRFTIPAAVLGALCRTTGEIADKRPIICCCPGHISVVLAAIPGLESVKFLSPSHSVFLQKLKKASLYIVQPGLYGPFEAFKLGVPLYFTTPFSYTQICQAKKFQQSGLLGQVPLWTDIGKIADDLKGSFGDEQKRVFETLNSLLPELAAEEYMLNEFDKWSRMVLANKAGSDILTFKRKEYANSYSKIKDTMINILKKRIS